MKTQRLFKEDVYLKTATAKILSLFADEDKCLVLLDRTIFFPEGGGQSSDKGTIEGCPLIHVYEEEEQIFHCLSKKDAAALSQGMEVSLCLDWEHRFDNMQRHCGEHILSGVFYDLYGGVNRGFHMGEDYMTIDISLEANPEYDKISWDMAKKAEEHANQIIWDNLPVITKHFDTKEEAEHLPLRKALTIEKDITIVSVGNLENPADCVACCGTHPASSAQVGMLKIYKVESNKGMFRIYFEAGKRAFMAYQARFDALTTLENKLSAGFSDILSKYDAQQEKTKMVRDELYRLKKAVIAREIKDLAAVMTPALVRTYDQLSVNDLLEIGRGLNGQIKTILFLVHKPSNTVLLFSDCHDCGALVKENASIYNGKGGGNKNSARAIFAKAEYVDTFIDLIEKHLR